MGDSEHYGITVFESSRSNEEEDSIDYKEFVAQMGRRLQEQRREEEQTYGRRKVCIYRVPTSLTGVCPEAIEPEMVSIGPYHHGKEKLLEFESYKWQFLSLLCQRLGDQLRLDDLLGTYYKAMKELEKRTRNCYSEVISMSSSDFVQMMVLDGCFIIELFQQMNTADEFNYYHSILERPWLIPVVTRDLLKLQNQLPFVVLEKLFEISNVGTEQSLAMLALQFFNHSLPRPKEVLKRTIKLSGAKHLLDLFHLSFLPTPRETRTLPTPRETRTLPTQRETRTDPLPQNSWFKCTLDVLCRVAVLPAIPLICFFGFLLSSRTPDDNDRAPDQRYRPSSESIQCTTQLRPSGVKFRPHRDAENLLDVDFQNGVLQIPPITINDLAIVVFINCMAFERCHQYTSQHFTAYIAFMSRLINSTRDVTLLCADGIITGFSLNDQNVAEMITKLGEKVVFNIRECYLSKQFRDVEAYYSSHWATFMRTYFSRPWSFITVLTAFTVLLLAGIQTIMAILSYLQKK
ncbi:UPF0481 protein At3g47200-like [Pyrus x bretschneideri]|uniref:UPF0481 protein At3g47200-like n=1 Tax=Pyrus x bretschneideri TaxID=225117 RepID=UPI00202E5D17|nr:UPF0481 protein At3g47200-like [Pyrus x bretschneideri]